MRGINLDAPLLQLSRRDVFTLRDACQGGVLVMGASGSGKTSASKYLAHGLLTAGAGGIVAVAKAEETMLWKRYCRESGRSKSLIVFDGTNGGYNFIAHELARQGADGLNSVVECLMRVLEIARNASPGGGREGEAFWEDTTRQILRNALPILYAATGTVRISDLLDFVRGAPHSPDQMRDDDWQRESAFCRLFTEAAPKLNDDVGTRTVAYWRQDFATLDAKTRGNIVISLTTALDRFNHGWLRKAFCEGSTIVPELTFHGAVILLDIYTATPSRALGDAGGIRIWRIAALHRDAGGGAYRAAPCHCRTGLARRATRFTQRHAHDQRRIEHRRISGFLRSRTEACKHCS